MQAYILYILWQSKFHCRQRKLNLFVSVPCQFSAFHTSISSFNKIRYLHFPRLLRSIDFQLVTDVFGQSVCLTFSGQAVYKKKYE